MKALALTIGLLFATSAFGWTTVTEDNLEAETLTATGIVVFTSASCDACKVYLPILDKLEAKYPALKFMKVDVDQSPELAAKLAPVVPMTYFLKDGQIVGRIPGTGTEAEVSKVFEDFNEFIKTAP